IQVGAVTTVGRPRSKKGVGDGVRRYEHRIGQLPAVFEHPLQQIVARAQDDIGEANAFAFHEILNHQFELAELAVKKTNWGVSLDTHREVAESNALAFC